MNHLIKTDLDAGFVAKCAEYGITDDQSVGELMKLAADLHNTEQEEMQKQASMQHNIELQKQANLNSVSTALDKGFVASCHEYGIYDQNEIGDLMKVAFLLMKQENLC